MDRDNPTGADNQQETESVRALEAWWVVGFIDGEGCFSVSIHRNRGAPHGWQLMPAFHAYQHRDHAHVLEELQGFFGCGLIRPKELSSSVLTDTVQDRRQLLAAVIPFFERHALVVKRADFAAFSTIVRSSAAKEHVEREGFERLVRLA